MNEPQNDGQIVVKPRVNEKEKKLDKIIEHIDNAEKYLRKAGEMTKEVGDRDGTLKIDKQASEVEKLSGGFKQMKEKR